ncbi:MAG: TolC family protein [Candidatus Latescibacteria bacterium]|nr:TolC family protein [Candidatus Latescibacterota bacterium]
MKVTCIINAAFVLLLGFAVAAAEGELSLEDCVRIAINNSHRIAIAKAGLTKAELNLKDSKAGYWPKLYLEGGYGLNNIYDRLEWTQDHYDLSVSLSETLYDNGKTLAQVKKSEANLTSQRESYRITETQLVLTVIERYCDLLLATELLKLNRESLQQKRRHLELAETRFNLGLAPRSDMLKAKVEVAGAELALLQAENDLEIARAELNNSMGLDLDRPTKVKGAAFTEEEPPGFDECLTAALKNRPEVGQTEANLMIRKWDLNLAKRERLPSLTLRGSYNINADRFAFSGVPLNPQNWRENTPWRVDMVLSFPIFDAGLTKRAVTKTELNLEEAEMNHSQLKKEITLEVGKAHLNLIASVKRIQLTGEQERSAQESYDATEGRYKAGVAPITEVIDAGVALSNSKVNRAQAIYNYLVAEAKLDKAMGK